MMMEEDDDGDEQFLLSHTHTVDGGLIGAPEETPSAASLLKCQPYKSGYLVKKRERCFGICNPFIKPVWNKRFFIISGRFLYRFQSQDGPSPKGVPIPLECTDFKTLDDEMVPYAFSVSILSKEMILAAESLESRREWLEQLRSAKQRAIKETLGHSKERGSHTAFNKIGSKLFKRKLNRQQQYSGDPVGDPSTIEMRAFGSHGFVDPHY